MNGLQTLYIKMYNWCKKKNEIFFPQKNNGLLERTYKI